METILIVDDNEDLRWNLSNILKNEGYETLLAEDGKRAIKAVKRRSPDLVLLDIRLPGPDGIQVLEEIRSIDKDVAVIMLTAFADAKDAVRAMKLSAFDYVTKPFDTEEIVLVIKKALETRYLGDEVKRLRKKLDEKKTVEQVMGVSPQIRHVLNQVNIVAGRNVTTILQGESGSGKELIAQMIHQNSLRKDKPFIAIDCGALSTTLAESELFGYEKGAFTGADERREGKFEQANGGTLLLDELTNLPDSIQMKLLRVIQERKLQHLGGKRDVRVDVRIIVATNIDLQKAVKAGKFREDLFHRLDEFEIHIPPLRERKEDIPVLAKCFLEEANQEFEKNIKGFSAETIRCFLDNGWAGNGRELRNVVRRAALLADSDTVTLAHLSADRAGPLGKLDFQGDLDKGASLREIVEKVTQQAERAAIRQALAKAGGNKSKAAKILKTDRMTLYSKMKKLNFA